MNHGRSRGVVGLNVTLFLFDVCADYNKHFKNKAIGLNLPFL